MQRRWEKHSGKQAFPKPQQSLGSAEHVCLIVAPLAEAVGAQKGKTEL